MFYPIQQAGLWGFINEHGTQIISPCFHQVSRFSDEVCCVTILDRANRRRSAFIDVHGELVIPPEPPQNAKIPAIWREQWSFGDFSGGFALFRFGDATGRSGYIDKTGLLVIGAAYLRAENFSEELACVALPGPNDEVFGPLPTGFIDQNGDFVIPPNRSFCATGFSDDLCAISVQHHDGSWKYGYINRSGLLQTELCYTHASSFHKGLGVVRLRTQSGPKYGMLDRNCDVFIEPVYDDVATFRDNGLAYVREGHTVSTVNTTGMVTSQFRVDTSKTAFSLSAIANGVIPFRVCRSNTTKWGYLTAEGEEFIRPIYDEAHAYEGELAFVRCGGSRSYIDRSGGVVWESTNWTDE